MGAPDWVDVWILLKMGYIPACYVIVYKRVVSFAQIYQYNQAGKY